MLFFELKEFMKGRKFTNDDYLIRTANC